MWILLSVYTGQILFLDLSFSFADFMPVDIYACSSAINILYYLFYKIPPDSVFHIKFKTVSSYKEILLKFQLKVY